MEFLLDYPETMYGLCVCLCTFVVLKYLIEKPTKKQKFITLFSSGIILGLVFWFSVECRLPFMILAFFSSMGFYELIIKSVMRKVGINYSGKIQKEN